MVCQVNGVFSIGLSLPFLWRRQNFRQIWADFGSGKTRFLFYQHRIDAIETYRSLSCSSMIRLTTCTLGKTFWLTGVTGVMRTRLELLPTLGRSMPTPKSEAKKLLRSCTYCIAWLTAVHSILREWRQCACYDWVTRDIESYKACCVRCSKTTRDH